MERALKLQEETGKGMVLNARMLASGEIQFKLNFANMHSVDGWSQTSYSLL
jgi:hypothetical protein